MVDPVEEQVRKRIQTEFALSGELLASDADIPYEGYYNVVNDDFVKSNTNPVELAALKHLGHSANLTGFVGTELRLDLRPLQLFLINEMKIDANVGRGKGGWAGFLSKTSKSITEQSLEEKSAQINNPQKQGIFSKIFGK